MALMAPNTVGDIIQIMASVCVSVHFVEKSWRIKMGMGKCRSLELKEGERFCPLGHPSKYGGGASICLKEKCAWWTGGEWGCIIQLIAYKLSEIENRMPYRVKY